MQGIVLMALYLIGFIAAIGSAFVMKFILKTKDRGFFVMEMPVYRMPRWSSIGIIIIEKVKIFLFGVGKIIIAISVVLWVLSSYGPGDIFKNSNNKLQQTLQVQSDGSEKRPVSNKQKDIDNNKLRAKKLSSSFIGIIGKVIEPVIAPLGFDWRTGIALITSFAAREVFVSSMATIYNIGDENRNKVSLREMMMKDVNPRTGLPVYTLAVGLSLMIFYVFAMQCISTLAIVYKETNSWKWPVVQTLYMSGLAYISSFLVYQLLK